MYSGTTFNKKSGRLMGVHQKIDRVARKHIQPLLPSGVAFPAPSQILHFEGKNGPDGIKRKSPAIDEPWHFINPELPENAPLLDMIDEHITNLAAALKDQNAERAAFEAAWMAHAVTDGLTPAHHFPLEETIKQLRGGKGLEARTSIARKNIMTGETKVQTLKNNWKYWGAKGAMTTHIAFETGVASVVAYQRFSTGAPSSSDIEMVRTQGYRAYFLQCIREVADMKMYERFSSSGWTAALAKQTNRQLMPLIIRAVTMGWLEAVWQAETENR